MAGPCFEKSFGGEIPEADGMQIPMDYEMTARYWFSEMKESLSQYLPHYGYGVEETEKEVQDLWSNPGGDGIALSTTSKKDADFQNHQENIQLRYEGENILLFVMLFRITIIAGRGSDVGSSVRCLF
ncbi:hypothetical protein JTE90_011369 [Oedothorax gibbosus]|uniref:Uncharacterized protein n=1 Tax=Oedothorax gibbosus TaxID=931172 RepID=A0AAV6VMS1_9ARAC|nr:hypothetical protein JTE90_011369 [Oedothorax gibbosus]